MPIIMRDVKVTVIDGKSDIKGGEKGIQPPRVRWVKCPSCTDGKCWNCGGSGHMKLESWELMLKQCSICHGSGKCQNCRGKGKIKLTR